jgi:hypothetical protein
VAERAAVAAAEQAFCLMLDRSREFVGGVAMLLTPGDCGGPPSIVIGEG